MATCPCVLGAVFTDYIRKSAAIIFLIYNEARPRHLISGIGSTIAEDIVKRHKSEAKSLLFTNMKGYRQVQEWLWHFSTAGRHTYGRCLYRINITGTVGTGIVDKYSLPLGGKWDLQLQIIFGLESSPAIYFHNDIGGEAGKSRTYVTRISKYNRFRSYGNTGTGGIINQMANTEFPRKRLQRA